MLIDPVSAALIRVIDDDPEVRQALEFMLVCEGYKVKTYESAISFLTDDISSQMGCIIADIRMPEMSGIELFSQLRERNYPVPLIFLTGHGDIDMAVEAMLNGAVDFIQKPVRSERLFQAINRAIIKNRSVTMGRCLDDIQRERAYYDTLSSREKEIIELISQGLMNKQIAERLGLSPRTVEVYRASALRKLQLRTPAEIALFLGFIRQGAHDCTP